MRTLAQPSSWLVAVGGLVLYLWTPALLVGADPHALPAAPPWLVLVAPLVVYALLFFCLPGLSGPGRIVGTAVLCGVQLALGFAAEALYAADGPFPLAVPLQQALWASPAVPLLQLVSVPLAVWPFRGLLIAERRPEPAGAPGPVPVLEDFTPPPTRLTPAPTRVLAPPPARFAPPPPMRAATPPTFRGLADAGAVPRPGGGGRPETLPPPTGPTAAEPGRPAALPLFARAAALARDAGTVGPPGPAALPAAPAAEGRPPAVGAGREAPVAPAAPALGRLAPAPPLRDSTSSAGRPAPIEPLAPLPPGDPEPAGKAPDPGPASPGTLPAAAMAVTEAPPAVRPGAGDGLIVTPLPVGRPLPTLLPPAPPAPASASPAPPEPRPITGEVTPAAALLPEHTAEAERVCAGLARVGGLRIDAQVLMGMTLYTVSSRRLATDGVARGAFRALSRLTESAARASLTQATLRGAGGGMVLTPLAPLGTRAPVLVAAVAQRGSLALLEVLSRRAAAGYGGTPAAPPSVPGSGEPPAALVSAPAPRRLAPLSPSFGGGGPVAPLAFRDPSGRLLLYLLLAQGTDGERIGRIACDLHELLESDGEPGSLGPIQSIALRLGRERVIIRRARPGPDCSTLVVSAGDDLGRPGLAHRDLERAATRLAAV